MGYRSDVAVRMSKRNYELMMESIRNLKEGRTDEHIKKMDLKKDGVSWLADSASSLEEFIRNGLLTEDRPEYLGDEGYVDFYWMSVKWHSFNKDVFFISYFMCLEDENGKSDYAFFRIGEDFDDVKSRDYTGTRPFTMSREIVFGQ